MSDNPEIDAIVRNIRLGLVFFVFIACGYIIFYGKPEHMSTVFSVVSLVAYIALTINNQALSSKVTQHQHQQQQSHQIFPYEDNNYPQTRQQQQQLTHHGTFT